MTEWSREIDGSGMPDVTLNVVGPGEEKARDEAGLNGLSGLTRAKRWRIAAVKQSAKTWTCSQCGRPGSKHIGAGCPPASAGPDEDEDDDGQQHDQTGGEW